MSRPLSVVVVAPHAVLGGQEIWLLQLLDATDRLSVSAVLLQDGPLREELERRGVPVTVIPVGTQPHDLVAPIVRLRRLLRRSRPDVVLANGSKAQFVAGPAARMAGVAVVFVRHDHSLERFVPLLAACADAVVGTTGQVLEAVGRSDSVVVLPPRPAEVPLGRDAARRELAGIGISLAEEPVLVMATRLVPYKGVDDAIVALARPAGAAWRLVILGGDDPSAPGERERLARLAQQCGVADRVQLAGHRAGVDRLLPAFDALAVLTKPGGRRDPGREGFGMAVLEAMLSGVPVIATGGGDIERRLGTDAGVVVPPGDPGAVAEALGRLTDPGRRARCAAAALDRVAGHPDAATSSQLLCGVLAATAGRPGAGLPAAEPVSVVVPVYNEEAGVGTVVESLLHLLRPYDELIVVDDASSDETPARLAALESRHRQLRVLRHAVNAGPSAARNSGVGSARHELLVCTDAGNRAPQGWLEGMRGALCDRPAPDLVTGAYRVSRRGALETAMAVALYPGVEETRHAGPLTRTYGRIFGRTFDGTRPAGRSLAFRRSAWQRVGGFPVHLRASEDIAFGRAVAASAGRCVLQTDEPVTWQQHVRLGATARMYAAYGRGDAAHGERLVMTRNLVRAVAALTAPALAARGGPRARALVLAGGGAYLSVPLLRLRDTECPLQSAVLVPVVLVVKDLSKAWGCVHGLWRRSR